MITVSDRYKTNAQAPVKSIQARLTMIDTSMPSLVIDSSGELISVKEEVVGSFNNIATKKLTVSIIGIHDELRDMTMKYETGIVDPIDKTVDWANQGEFIVDTVNVDFDKGSTQAVMYDKIFQTSKLKYVDRQMSFPMTVQSMARYVADTILADLDPNFANLPNASYTVREDLYAKINNFTYQNILTEIAQSTGTTAIMSEGVLEFRPFKPNSNNETLDENSMKTFKLGEKWGVVNSIVLSRQPQNDDIAMKNDASIATNNLTELKIINVEILDDERQTLIQPLYDALIAPDNLYMDAIVIKTEGHGWYEVGDTLEVVINGKTYKPFITAITLNVAGSLDEQISCVIPGTTNTNYSTAGSIVKSIYNTEIKTDKQGQQIDSVVSRQDQMDGMISKNFTQIHQDINEITQIVQTTGSGNLIKNSVGYGKTNDTNQPFMNWTKNAVGAVSSHVSPESLEFGGMSGNVCDMNGGATLTQRVNVVANDPDTLYSLSFLAKKGAVGQVNVRLTNDNDDFEITLNANTEYNWAKQVIKGFMPTMNYLDITISTTTDVALFNITDLMLSLGKTGGAWTQAQGEILNTQVSLNEDGITVRSSVYDGDYTVITPLEFSGYSVVSGQKQRVFSLNRDTTSIQKLHVDNQIEMPPIKIVPIMSGVRAGWSFVKIVS